MCRLLVRTSHSTSNVRVITPCRSATWYSCKSGTNTLHTIGWADQQELQGPETGAPKQTTKLNLNREEFLAGLVGRVAPSDFEPEAMASFDPVEWEDSESKAFLETDAP